MDEVEKFKSDLFDKLIKNNSYLNYIEINDIILGSALSRSRIKEILKAQYESKVIIFRNMNFMDIDEIKHQTEYDLTVNKIECRLESTKGVQYVKSNYPSNWIKYIKPIFIFLLGIIIAKLYDYTFDNMVKPDALPNKVDTIYLKDTIHNKANATKLHIIDTISKTK